MKILSTIMLLCFLIFALSFNEKNNNLQPSAKPYFSRTTKIVGGKSPNLETDWFGTNSHATRTINVSLFFYKAKNDTMKAMMTYAIPPATTIHMLKQKKGADKFYQHCDIKDVQFAN
jgi:hypothetical protein